MDWCKPLGVGRSYNIALSPRGLGVLEEAVGPDCLLIQYPVHTRRILFLTGCWYTMSKQCGSRCEAVCGGGGAAKG